MDQIRKIAYIDECYHPPLADSAFTCHLSQATLYLGV